MTCKIKNKMMHDHLKNCNECKEDIAGMIRAMEKNVLDVKNMMRAAEE